MIKTLFSDEQTNFLTRRYTPRTPKSSGLNLNIKHILSFKNSESNYLFGFLWGDGWISKIAYRINFQFVKDDYLDLVNCFNSWGKWHIYFKNKSNQNIVRKDSVDISGNSELLFNFLKTHDYDIKSKTSPSKILEVIPNKHHYIFWRGYIDADGCWYYNSKNILRQFSLSGSHDQDWSDFEKLCNNLDIKYTIVRRTQFAKKLNKMTSSSICRITGKYNLLRLGQYIYPKGFDNIGLKRKYDKYTEIINSIKRW